MSGNPAYIVPGCQEIKVVREIIGNINSILAREMIVRALDD